MVLILVICDIQGVVSSGGINIIIGVISVVVISI